MATPENSFISGVHKYVQCYAEKMNNPYRGGTPDVWYSGSARDLWVEYKFIKIPLRPATIVVPDLSALQKMWLRNRKAEKRNVAVIVGCKEGAVILLTPSDWEQGLRADKFRSTIVSRRDVGGYINDFCKRVVAHAPRATATGARDENQ